MTTKTIAEYSADPSNPWNTWLVDNTRQEHRATHLKVQNLQSTAETNRWTGGFLLARINESIIEAGIDRDAFCDEWLAYEEFKIALANYRLKEVAA